MKNSKKVTAPAETDIHPLLQGIRDGIFYAAAHEAFSANGYERACAGFGVLKACGISTDSGLRYTMQTVSVPIGIRGGLAKFGGKTVTFICTAIHKTSAQMCMWAKENV